MALADKFKSLRQRASLEWRLAQSQHREAALANRVTENAHPRPGEAPVIFFNASTRLMGLSLNAAYSLLSAWALRLQGIPVVHFVCRKGMTCCVLGTKRDQPDLSPPCRACLEQSRALYAGADVEWFGFENEASLEESLAGFDLQSLGTYEYAGMPLGKLVLPALRWSLRRYDLIDNEITLHFYREYIRSAWNMACRFEALLEKRRPRAVVLFNGTFYPEAAVRWVARKHGIPAFSHESGFLPRSAFFTRGEATAYPLEIPSGYTLTSGQERRLDEYLEKRFQGNFSMAGIRFWPEMKNLGEDFWQRADRFKQVVPIFTNVVFDTSQGHANVVFPDMFAWLDRVLELIRAHPETYFVLRAHPDEYRPGKESHETVSAWVERNRLEALPNARFVDADQYLSSYELIGRSKFVMIYNSTIGMEAAILGAAVLAGGKPRFTDPPAVFFPPSPEAFTRQAEAFLSAAQVEAPPEHRINARRFLYFQLYRSSLPFDEFIEEGGPWRGFAHFKDFPLEALSPDRSTSIRAIVDGILNGGDFLLPEDGR